MSWLAQHCRESVSRCHLASDSINLSTHVDDVVNEIKWKDLDGLVLVGHSSGGGHHRRCRAGAERIAAIVYLDAFMPEDGQSLATLAGPGAAAMPEHVVPPIPAATFRVNAKDAAWVDSKMTPHPVKCFTESLRVSGAYQTVPRKVYIRARDFPSTTFDAAFNRCQADRAWRTVEMKCGHDIMIDQPGELAAVLEGLGQVPDPRKCAIKSGGRAGQANPSCWSMSD